MLHATEAKNLWIPLTQFSVWLLRCLKYCPYLDYSRFDCPNWTPQTGEYNKGGVRNCYAVLKCEIEQDRNLGCRYSCLNQLSYFDTPCMLVVDHMHNLLQFVMLNLQSTRIVIKQRG